MTFVAASNSGALLTFGERSNIGSGGPDAPSWRLLKTGFVSVTFTFTSVSVTESRVDSVQTLKSSLRSYR
jgi:hypothetical protein